MFYLIYYYNPHFINKNWFVIKFIQSTLYWTFFQLKFDEIIANSSHDNSIRVRIKNHKVISIWYIHPWLKLQPNNVVSLNLWGVGWSEQVSVPIPRAKHAPNHERYWRHSCHATYDQDSPTCILLATDLVISQGIQVCWCCFLPERFVCAERCDIVRYPAGKRQRNRSVCTEQ